MALDEQKIDNDKKEEDAEVRKPTESEELFLKHWSKFLDYKQIKEQTVRFFNKNGKSRNILDYVQDSIDRMNEYKPFPAHKEDWQQNIFDPVTRDKVIAILSKLVSARLKIELNLKPTSIWTNDGLSIKTKVFSDLLDAANRKNHDQEELIWEMYTGLTEGTVIGYEGYIEGTRDVEFVKGIDPDTGEKTTEKMEQAMWDDVYGEIVPINEWYPETIWTHKIDNIKRCFWIEELKMDNFRDKYGKYPNADKVMPAASYFDDTLLKHIFNTDILAENVQVMHFYDEAGDKMGLWANSQELYYGCLPFNHKKIPFWIGVGEPIHNKFLFGKSLPDKLMAMQDINNGLFNAMLDQVFMALNSPIFVDGDIDDLDDGYLTPNRIYSMEQGTKIQKGGLGTVDPNAYNMLNLVKTSIQSTSISDQAQGIPTGGRKTKFEFQALQEGALNLAGLFIQMIEGAMKRKYYLRTYNMLQYYSMPSKFRSGKSKFKFIQIDKTELSNGKRGKKLIQIVDNKTDAPDEAELRETVEKETGEEFNALESTMEPVVITRDFLMNKDFELGIEIVPNSSIKESEQQKKRNDVTFYQMTSQDPAFDQDMNKKDLAAAFDKDPRIVKEEPEEQDPLSQLGAGGGEQNGGVPPSNINVDAL